MIKSLFFLLLSITVAIILAENTIATKEILKKVDSLPSLQDQIGTKSLIESQTSIQLNEDSDEEDATLNKHGKKNDGDNSDKSKGDEYDKDNQIDAANDGDNIQNKDSSNKSPSNTGEGANGGDRIIDGEGGQEREGNEDDEEEEEEEKEEEGGGGVSAALLIIVALCVMSFCGLAYMKNRKMDGVSRVAVDANEEQQIQAIVSRSERSNRYSRQDRNSRNTLQSSGSNRANVNRLEPIQNIQPVVAHAIELNTFVSDVTLLEPGKLKHEVYARPIDDVV